MSIDAYRAFQEHRAGLEGIGSSDAATIVGLSSYMSPLELYAIMRGEAERESETEIMKYGRILEPAVAQLAAERLEKRVTSRNQFRRRKRYPWQWCHLDRTCEGKPLELKTAPYSREWQREEELGELGVPTGVRVQVMHQIAVVDAPFAWVAALIAGAPPVRLYQVWRNDALIDDLTEAEHEFYFNHVLKGIPPEADGSESAARYLRRRYPQDDGVELIATAEQELWAAKMFEHRALRLANKTQEEGWKNKLIQAMGDHAVLRAGNFEISYRSYPKPTIHWEYIAGAYRVLLEDEVALERFKAAGSSLDTLIELYTEEKQERRFVPKRIGEEHGEATG